MKWFRMYAEVLHDRKVQKLPAELLRAWLNLLCLACGNTRWGHLPPLEDVAFALHVSEKKASDLVESLVKAGLLDRDAEGGLRPHNWDARQYKSDDINSRVKDFRRKKAAEKKPEETLHATVPRPENQRTSAVHPTLKETPPDSDPNSEAERRESLSNDNDSSRGREEVVVDGGTFQIVSPEHRKTVEHARTVIGDRFAAVVADQGSSLDASLGGRWDCYRAAIDQLKACGKRIDKPAVYCRQMALSYIAHGIPTVAEVPLEPSPSLPRVYGASSEPPRLTARQEKDRRVNDILDNLDLGPRLKERS